MDTKQMRDGTTVVGALLVVLGLIFFAVTQGAFDISWGTIWPVFPTLAGAFLLLLASISSDVTRRSGLVFAGTIPFLVGIFYFLITNGLLSWGNMGRLWPIYPLIVGAAFFAAYVASGMTRREYLIPGGIVTTVALVFGAILWSGADYGVIGKLWPLALIIAGVALLLPRLGKRAES